MSYDTPEFATDAIKTWLLQFAEARYSAIQELLILCDNGGSNGSRSRMWKYALCHEICKVYGIRIRVCHYPTGASKWNPVGHRLFSFISRNWQGRPLRSVEKMLSLIRSATTEDGKGSKVEAVLNEKQYEKGLKVSDSQMKKIKLAKHDVLPRWNYSLIPG
ncbi:hypothetical protein QUF80_10610 [Desulfococcaceae bacterium HSG8]|nr:hypothetical protein [Desulfococcaceae bacterium HSG8]